MDNKINLDTLNDQQKILLSQISYLDINNEGRNKIEKEGLSVLELKQYLNNPNDPFCGKAILSKNGFNSVADNVFGNKEFPTKIDIVDTLIQNGLGNLKITNINDEQKLTSSGFQAMTFTDSYGNVGISYRGSDLDLSRGGVRDWIESDMLEYFTNNSTQRLEALEYFNANKSNNGNNYVYGHSLGGNLTSHVYAENYNEIQEAFTINGNPINQKLLDTPEKVQAFNDSKKYNCNIVCGDIVGHLKSCEAYKDNVNYIKNNDTMKSSFISAHLVQSATFDENGNFVKASKEEMIVKTGIFSNIFIKFVQNVREIMNKFSEKFDKHKSNEKSDFEKYKEDLYTSFDNKFEELNIENVDSLDLNQNTKNEDLLKKQFEDISKDAEMEIIEDLKKQLIEREATKLEKEIYQQEIYDENINQNEEDYSRVR